MLREKFDRQEVFKRVVRSIKTIIQSSKEEEEGRPLNISSETDVFSDLGIDSVEVMDLLAAIENEFKISIDLDSAALKRKVGDLVEIVWKKLKVL